MDFNAEIPLFSFDPLNETPRKSIKHNLAFSITSLGISSYFNDTIKSANFLVIIIKVISTQIKYKVSEHIRVVRTKKPIIIIIVSINGFYIIFMIYGHIT